MPKKIDAALRSQAVRLVTEHRAEYSSERALHIQSLIPSGCPGSPCGAGSPSTRSTAVRQQA